MKKIILILSVFALLATSCSLNEKRPNSLDTNTAITNAKDAASFANYLNVYLRAYSSGSYIYYPEIAADFFNPSVDYGNRIGTQYRWDWSAGTSFNAYWSPAYYAINHACFLIENIENLDKTNYSAEDLATLDKCLGLAYFSKAYFGLKLLNYYCEPYNTANLDKYGIMLVDLHRPTGDITAYPGRSTLQESYQWVKENLAKAEHYLAIVPGAVGSTQITIDAVRAFQARLALEMQDWDLAIAKSTALVDGGKYPLCGTQEEMTALWTNDSGKECIVQMYADLAANSLPSSNDPGYFGYTNSTGRYTPDWIINKWVATMYSATDLRWTTWFKPGVTVQYAIASGTVTLMNKFPGNMSLQTTGATQSSHLQKIKLFRIAEQYLIAAEAYAMLGANIPACTYLDKLLNKRDASHMSLSLTGDDLLNFIKEERAKELIGEGFRWNDLKRWGKGMQRPDAQNTSIVHTGGSNGPALNLNISPTDHRWAGPIPSSELSANPQIRNQQNPGY